MLLLCIAQWLLFLPTIVILNGAWGFSDGGDDWDYYRIVTSFNSLDQAFDPYSYVGALEQPGYPILLAPFALLSGGDLLALKLVNLGCFIVMTSVWSRIGLELRGEEFARLAGKFVCILTPVWYYVLFLLKDVPISLLQAVAVLGGVLICNRRYSIGFGLVALSTLLLIPFRSFLSLVSVVIVVASVVCLHRASAHRGEVALLSGRLASGVSLLAASIGIYALFASDLASMMGVLAENRKLSLETLTDQFERGGESVMKRSLFPVLYFMSETSGISALLLGFDNSSEALRGIFALPWILFFLPFLIAGIYYLVVSLRFSGLLRSPWLVVTVFCVTYLIISWTIGDTTRWRLPDLPALATIAALGFTRLHGTTKTMLLLGWPVVTLTLAGLFYSSLR